MPNGWMITQQRIDAEFYEKIAEYAHRKRMSKNAAMNMLLERGYAEVMNEDGKALEPASRKI